MAQRQRRHSCFRLDPLVVVEMNACQGRKEHPRLANRFADTIDVAYELGERKSDEMLRDSMADALDVFFGNRQDCDIF